MTGGTVLRFGMLARLRPERREEYLELHRAVWPAVEATLSECGIRNFSIFVRRDVIVGYYEYVGDDFDADQARMAEDPHTQEWWSRTGPCQLPFEADSTKPNWQLMEETWHLA